MTNLEIEIIRDLVDNSERSYYHFFLNFWSTICKEKLVENWHVGFLCDELQKIGERVINREAKEFDYTIINISPSESKSSICTQLFPVWLWVKDPTLRLITGSFAATVSIDHGTKSRDCIESNKFKAIFGDRFSLRADIKAKSNYQTVEGGQRVSTSTGGAITGKHAHLQIIDDPLDPRRAASEAELLTADKWFFETLSSRTVSAELTPTIVVMQRLDEEDTTGKILAKASKGLCTVNHIKLPADDTFEILPEDCKEHYTKGIMNPFRHPSAVLTKKKNILGASGYACQYGQSQTAKDGNIIKKDWFRRFTFNWLDDYAEQHNQMIIWNFTVDGAETDNAENDATAIMAYAEINNRLFVRKVQSVRKELLDCVDFIERFAIENGYTDASEIRVEPKSSGRQIEQTFKTLLPTFNVILDESPKVDKKTRVKAKKSFLETRKAYLLEDGIWIDNFLIQVGGFPNMKHDDEVDVLIIAIHRTQNEHAVWSGGY